MFQETILNFTGLPQKRGQVSTTGLGGGSAAGPSGLATITVPNNRFEHSETVSASGVTATSRVILGLAPCADSDENCPEMLDIISYVATPADGSLTITAAFSQLTSGPVKFNWSAI